ncbi:MAG: cyclic pyranopterin monophosphate synthase MoaC [Planctomycetes bacterium]|nr:cyclic pyranopterin monophosphate synthase MoaC [Planctomycetota bacterium]
MSKGFELSHLDGDGRSKMVDVGGKAATLRIAIAEARVTYPPAAFAKVVAGDLPKGGIVEPARIAGIMAAKRTSDLIPMCHPLSLEQVEVEVTPSAADSCFLQVRCTCRLTGRTGVEMEAMTGAAVAALTLYDMSKALDKGIQIESVRLIEKSGGKSGRWTAQ